MSLRILVVCNKFPYPPKDGGAIATFNMIKAFHQAGHTLKVLSMNTPKHFTKLDDLPRYVKEMADFVSVNLNTRPNVFDLLGNFLFSSKAYHVERFSSSGFEQACLNILKEEEFDVIQMESLYLSVYVEPIRDFLKANERTAQIVYRAHNVENEIWERKANNERAFLKKYYFDITAARIKNYETHIAKSSLYDGILTVTGRDAGFFQKLKSPAEVEPIGIGVDMEAIGAKMKRPKDYEYPSIFYIGSLDWLPNIEGLDWFMNQVWPIIYRRYPDVRLYLAGRNMPARYLSIRKDRVVSLGEVEDAYAFMRSKAIMVVPLFSGSGMRVKIIEGMAMGKAIVATTVAVEGIPTRKGDNILIADEAKEFANAVGILIEKESLVNALGKHAANMAQRRFDNQQLVGKFEDFYKKLKAKAKAAKAKAQKEAKAAKEKSE